MKDTKSGKGLFHITLFSEPKKRIWARKTYIFDTLNLKNQPYALAQNPRLVLSKGVLRAKEGQKPALAIVNALFQVSILSQAAHDKPPDRM